MFKNYLKIALRNIIKHKGYSLINISGLAIGIACCVLILLFVQYELSYDRYHAHAENIYRLERDVNFHEVQGLYPVTAHPYGPTLQSDFPEVAQAVRIWPSDTDYLDKNNLAAVERGSPNRPERTVCHRHYRVAGGALFPEQRSARPDPYHAMGAGLRL